MVWISSPVWQDFITVILASVFDFLSPSDLVPRFLKPVWESLFLKHLLCLWCHSLAPEVTTPYYLSQCPLSSAWSSELRNSNVELSFLFVSLPQMELLPRSACHYVSQTQWLRPQHLPAIWKDSIKDGYVYKVFSNLLQFFLFLH